MIADSRVTQRCDLRPAGLRHPLREWPGGLEWPRDAVQALSARRACRACDDGRTARVSATFPD